MIAGARPNFMKIAPLMSAFSKYPQVHCRLVHTGQHYDPALSRIFFDELGIPKPDVNLEVGSGSHASQTAEIMKRFEKVLEQSPPHAVIVVGDVNSTIACGLVAVKMGIRLAHVEAGLRSFDRTMPEEINRVLTDAISDLLFCSEASGVTNLRREGVPEDKIFLVGNVMIDTLLRHRERAEASRILETLGLETDEYVLLTLHRPSNVDSDGTLARIFAALEVVQKERPVVFPVHPRTRKAITSGTLARQIADMPGLKLVDPLGYLDFIKLMAHAKVVLTDSGGIQEETTVLQIPCLTLRNNTERPSTIEMGTNRLVGADPDRILAGYRTVLANKCPVGKIPPFWDGHAAERIAEILIQRWA
mgnify:CR=1 FL=1